ncbi:MAG: nitrous oxide reductase accessory protein NosL [Halobacteriales archaeon]
MIPTPEGPRAVVLPRRQLLIVGAVVAGGAVSGCLGGTDEVPEPIALDGDKYCDTCGMLIEAQPGPAGQAHYDGFAPEAHDPPAWFCSATCAYEYTFERERDGHDLEVLYLTDYTAVDWEVTTDDDARFITAHLSAEAFARARELSLVAGSEVRGAMGADLIGFSEAADAEAFVDEFGGTIYTHDEVTPELVASMSA